MSEVHEGQSLTNPVEILLDKPRQIKFGIGILRRAEAVLGGFVGPLGLNILCTLLLYGLQTDDPKITMAKVDSLLDKYLQAGGTMEEISAKVREALERAGITWERKKAAADGGEEQG